MVQAYLQSARETGGGRVVDGRGQVARYVRFAGPYALAAIPARYAVERGDWAAATKLEPTPGAFPFAEALTHFARGLGAARTGDAAGAEKEGLELARLRDALKAAKNAYCATEARLRRLGVAACAALARGKSDDALALMRSAADPAAPTVNHIVPPLPILPPL